MGFGKVVFTIPFVVSIGWLFGTIIFSPLAHTLGTLAHSETSICVPD